MGGAWWRPPKPKPCGCCRKRPLPGRSLQSPDGDLLCDVCAVPSKADKQLAAIVNARIAARAASESIVLPAAPVVGTVGR